MEAEAPPAAGSPVVRRTDLEKRMAVVYNAYISSEIFGAGASMNKGAITMRRTVAASAAIAVAVLDHIIISGQNYYSFRENGRL